MDSLSSILLYLFLLSSSLLTSTEGYDRLDPTGNITIRWDVMSWTTDGYVAVVSMFNFQKHRRIQKPGWALSWKWPKGEVIWRIVGGQTTEQGDCSMFTGNVPQCCHKTPTVVDLLPGTPYSRQVAHCCKAGVLSSWGQDPANAVSAFLVTVGQIGTTDKTMKLPKSFVLKAPRPGYACGRAKIVRATRFVTPDKRRVTTALMTWKVTCTYLVHAKLKANDAQNVLD